MSAEETVKATIRQFEKETLNRLEDASAFGKAGVVEWVKTYIANLSVELPMSVKSILDAGGAVRQVLYQNKEHNTPQVDFGPVHSFNTQLFFRELAQADYVRFTVIAEPIEAPKRR